MPHYIEPLYRPPSEARSLIFQITIGCSQNHCLFCNMYKDKKFRLRPVQEILEEIAEIPDYYRSRIGKIFLADGDALVYPFDGLMTILDALAATFPELTRVSAYASPRSLTTKDHDQLVALREKRLKLLYFGLESGDDSTLEKIHKGYTADHMAELSLMAREAGMKLSVTAILGLGGKARSMEHARSTAAWANRVNPEFFSLLTLFRRENDEFINTLDQCSIRELMLEAREMLVHMDATRTIFRSNHLSNILSLSGTLPKDRERLIAQVDSTIAKAETHRGYLDSLPDYDPE